MAFGKHINQSKIPIINEVVNDDLIHDGFIFNKKDKWKLVSHMHKSIRHGESESARLAAERMYLLDKNYARYRLAVIAFEDVAGGNIDLINDIMRKGWKNENIEKNGGAKWFAEQAYLMANSIKDRLANDFCMCAIFLEEYLNFFNLKKLEDQSIKDAEKIAWNLKLENPYFRAIAAWRVVGTKIIPNKLMDKFEGDWDLWIKSNKENGVSNNVIECMEFGFKNQNEGSPIFLGIVSLLQNENMEIINNKFIKFPDIGPYSSSSIDKHTAEGKRAIAEYINNNEIIQKYINNGYTTYENMFKFVGKLQFKVEGGVLNKTYDYQIKKDILLFYWKYFVEKMGINKEMYIYILKDKDNWQNPRIKYTHYKKDERG